MNSSDESNNQMSSLISVCITITSFNQVIAALEQDQSPQGKQALQPISDVLAIPVALIKKIDQLLGLHMDKAAAVATEAAKVATLAEQK
jgi:hypothetical protein